MQLKHECQLEKLKHMELHVTHLQKYKISILLLPIKWRVVTDVDQSQNENHSNRSKKKKNTLQ